MTGPGYDRPVVDEAGEFAAAVIPGSPEAAAEAEQMEALAEQLCAEADGAEPLTDEQLDELARLDAV